MKKRFKNLFVVALMLCPLVFAIQACDESTPGCTTVALADCNDHPITHDVYYADSDGDGFGDPAMRNCQCFPSGDYVVDTGGDCDDTDDAIYKGRAEECDGADNDCNGVVDDIDEDGDFFSACRVSGERIDCRDDDPNSHPRAEELCDGIDNDCDDEIDEGCP